MSDTKAQFEEIQAALERGGVAEALDVLARRLLAEKRFHELFEARKMQVRQRLGLPLLYRDSADELTPEQRDALEEGLIAACREVGLALLREGKVREGYMYMRPVGDRQAVAEILAQLEPTEENLEELIEVALTEGVDTAMGYRLVLEHYGTCNAITTFESQIIGRSRAEQQACAALLVRHVHHELMANVVADIARQEGSPPREQTLLELVADRPWLFSEMSYHIDTTHLASTVRFSRILEHADDLRLALDLTEYGRRLHPQFQFRGDEPFADIYPSHRLYLQAVLGENADEAVAYFRRKAETLDVKEVGTAAIEIYVELLARLGRYSEAIDETLRLMPPDARPIGYAPSLFELCEKAGDFRKFLQACRERGDLLGFATGLCHARLQAQ